MPRNLPKSVFQHFQTEYIFLRLDSRTSVLHFHNHTCKKCFYVFIVSAGCKGFLCENTGHCLYTDLECNEVLNCGMYQKDGKWLKDESDEASCKYSIERYLTKRSPIQKINSFCLHV